MQNLHCRWNLEQNTIFLFLAHFLKNSITGLTWRSRNQRVILFGFWFKWDQENLLLKITDLQCIKGLCMIQKLPTIEHKDMLFCNIALHCNIVFVMERLYISGRFLGHSQGCGLSRLRSKPNLQQDILEWKSLTTKARSYILRRPQNLKKKIYVHISFLFSFWGLFRKLQFHKAI